MGHERYHDSNRISIRSEWNRNRVEKDGNQDTSSGACHDHVDELIGECGIVTCSLEYFASYNNQQKEASPNKYQNNTVDMLSDFDGPTLYLYFILTMHVSVSKHTHVFLKREKEESMFLRPRYANSQGSRHISTFA